MQEHPTAAVKNHVDFSELLARVDNDRELLGELLSIFREDFPRHLLALREAFAGRDTKQAAIVSHTLKGMLANLAVTKAAAAAAQLEQVALHGPEDAQEKALWAFEKEVDGLLQEMLSHMVEAQR